jgi:hypothetical protein
MEGSKKEFTFDMWKCPHCGCLVHDCQMKAFPLSQECMQCGTSLDDFIFCPGKPDVHPAEKNSG